MSPNLPWKSCEDTKNMLVKLLSDILLDLLTPCVVPYFQSYKKNFKLDDLLLSLDNG